MYLADFVQNAMLLISSVSPLYYKITSCFPGWTEIDHTNVMYNNI